MEWVQRSATFGTVRGPVVYALRNFANCTSRSETDADWEKEFYNRMSWSVPKAMPLDPEPYTAWDRFTEWSFRDTAETHVMAIQEGSREVETMESWWQARHHHTPGGSSSLRPLARSAMLGDSRLRAQDRPNKKAVMEVLPANWLFRACASLPVAAARTSTKNEPGEKNRAIHANNDDSYCMEAYASVHAEKALDFKGMYGKQTPSDVVRWMRLQIMALNSLLYWTSLDYADFNTEHHKLELANTNVARQHAWLKLGRGEVRFQKAFACAWMDEAHTRSYLINKEYGSYRVFNGLYSGSRNTLQDHQYLHRAYASAANVTAQRLGFKSDPVDESFTGDDEDRLDHTMYGAIGYSNAILMAGHNVQPSKQEGGGSSGLRTAQGTAKYVAHSYLQRKMYGDTLPIRPLAKILSTLGSGNWYVEPGVWFDSAIQSSADNWWECVTRGMPLKMARVMCATMLDRLMVVLPERTELEKAVKLEWWRYRKPETHPLWLGTGGCDEDCPIVGGKPEPKHDWPCAATDDWLKRVEPVLKHLREGRADQYRNYLLRESIGPSFHHYRQRSQRDEARKYWPQRVEQRYNFEGQIESRPISMYDIVRSDDGTPSRRRPVDEEEQAAQMGVDVYLLQLCGSAYNLRAWLRPEQWARYQTISPKLVPNAACMRLDSALRAWVSARPFYDPLFHAKAGKARNTKLTVVWAPNGAGKSTMCRVYPHMLDMDVSAYKHVGWLPRRERIEDGTHAHFREAQAAIHDALEYGKRIIVTQWPLRLFHEAAAYYECELSYAEFEPGVELRAQRLAARGWEPARVNKYIEYGIQNHLENEQFIRSKNLKLVKINYWQELSRL